MERAKTMIQSATYGSTQSNSSDLKYNDSGCTTRSVSAHVSLGKMKFELNESLSSHAVLGLEWGHFTCPGCQSGRYLTRGAFRRVFSVDQHSCDMFRRHLLVEHAINDHDERVRIVEFLRRSAIETNSMHRINMAINAFPFYSCCSLCDKSGVFATCHAAITHLATFHQIADAKSVMHTYSTCRGLWSSVQLLQKSMTATVTPALEDAINVTVRRYNCPFCSPKEKTYQYGALELHLFAQHWVRNGRFLDSLLQQARNNRKQKVLSVVISTTLPSIGDEKLTARKPGKPANDELAMRMNLEKPAGEMIDANFTDCPDSALYWGIPDLPATLRLMSSHRQLCQTYLKNLMPSSSSILIMCNACPRDKQPVFDRTNMLSGLLKHLEMQHNVESAYHLFLFSMQKRTKARDLHLAYYIIGHHMLDFQAFLNPYGSHVFADRFEKAVPNMSSHCPFCCIFGAVSPTPVPKTCSAMLASHLKTDHMFKNKRFTREIAELLFGKAVYIETPIELLPSQ